MSVTDHQVATLRALLAGDFDEHNRLREQLDSDADREGYTALMNAAFYLAAYQRFPEGHTRAEITKFVASVRAISTGAAEQIDPRLAERLIRGVFEDETIDDVPDQIVMATQVLLLAALVSVARHDAAEREEFLAVSRELADRWIG